jgi:hypothetical protein
MPYTFHLIHEVLLFILKSLIFPTLETAFYSDICGIFFLTNH